MQLTSGFINLNKPSGISSAAAVSRVKILEEAERTRDRLSA